MFLFEFILLNANSVGDQSPLANMELKNIKMKNIKFEM